MKIVKPPEDIEQSSEYQHKFNTFFEKSIYLTSDILIAIVIIINLIIYFHET